MNSHHITLHDLCGNRAVEEIELREAGGTAGFADESPAVDNGADRPSDEELDAMWVAEMERRDREAATVFGDDDTDPTRPGGGALPADVATYPASAARYSDAMLMEAIALADEEPERLCLDPVRREAWLSAMTTELLRRLAA